MRKKEVINENILDFLGGLFEKLAAWANAKAEQASREMGETRSALVSAAGKNIKDSLPAVSKTQLDNFNSVLSDLSKASKAKTWAPPSDSDADVKAWEKSADADAAAVLWTAAGKLIGSIQFWGEHIPTVKSDAEKLASKKSESPAEICQDIADAAGVLQGVWKDLSAKEWLTEAEVKPITGALSKIISANQDIANKIKSSAEEIKESLGMRYPFSQKKQGGRLIREFSKNVSSRELVWHRDRADRYVKVKRGKGWQLQFENCLPKDLSEGKTYFIPKNTYHRVIKGSTKLVVEIKEDSKMQITEKELRSLIREMIDVPEEMGRQLGYGEGEGRMTKSQLYKIGQYGAKLHDMLGDDDDLPEWVQAKIAVIAHDIGKIKHYLEYKIMRDHPQKEL